MSERTGQKVALGLVVPALIWLATAIALAASAERLPDPMATHWDLGGRPDGNLPRDAGLYLPILLMGIVAWFGKTPRDHPPALAVIYGVMLGGAGLGGALVWANWEAETWRDARTLNAAVGLTAILVPAALGAWIGWRLQGRFTPPLPRAHPAPATIEGPIDHRARLGGGVPLAMGVIAVVVAFAVSPAGVAFVIGAVGVAMLTFSLVTVRIDEQGVRVSFGPLAWPTIRIAWEHITGATTEDVTPIAYGGWGYRLRKGVRAVVLRRGPGLRIETTGSDLVITMDDPEHVAALINGVVQQREL